MTSIGNNVLHLQRLGSIESSLDLFKDAEGFNKIIDNVRKLVPYIVKTNLDSTQFDIYFKQLLRYFSELSFPQYVHSVSGCGISFQPRDIGNGLRSCDNLFNYLGSQIGVEITTISTDNKNSLPLKIQNIFENKAQEQISNHDGILLIDISLSCKQIFEIETRKFKVEFTNIDYIAELCRKELDKEENSHLLGVVVLANVLVTKDSKAGISWSMRVLENVNNSKSDMLPKLLSKQASRCT
ncbi:hypothetical protein K9L67_06085 [Candidatus Woesearchaeota archaeon]|nr:hypothetical protein [Candidatus Woesearchaeota archaeon]MCF7901763.1 hypothetical protein [Candidatus Woesearchaeota archaeon]